MLQPCMKNKREYKVVVLNKKALYIAESPSKNRGAAFQSPHKDLFTFAEDAVIQLVKNCPDTLANYSNTSTIIRVDIFQNKNNDLIVNEFESLEARIWPADDRSGTLLSTMTTHQTEFWINELRILIQQVLDIRCNKKIKL